MNIKIASLHLPQKGRLYIGRNILSQIGGILQSHCRSDQIVILTNNRVRRLWSNPLEESLIKYGIDYRIITIPEGERYKSFDMYRKLIARLTALKLDRQGTLLTFGGGVIGDLGGFVAATYKRGIRLIHIPTTLIAQIDSSIGGKVALDLPEGKNLVGTFYNPDCIIADTEILSTLNDSEFKNGLFEAIKIALVTDSNLYDFIENNLDKIMSKDKNIIQTLVNRCAQNKIKVVRRDPYDFNVRMILNFGHTLGHALETASGYKILAHGQAVGWGMLFAFHLSESSGLCRVDRLKRPYQIVSKLLSGKKLNNINGDDLWRIVCNDKKKKNNRVRFVLLKQIGRPVISEVGRKEFLETLDKLCANHPKY